MNIEQLRERMRAGWRPDYVLFLEPEPVRPGELGPECLCQWFPSELAIQGERFATAEHYMMWRKARLFGDDECAARILSDDDPAIAKRLGREFRGFREDVWERHRIEVVLEGSLAKFTQHAALGRYLQSTSNRVLAEASPVDRIWGIGFGVDDERALDPYAWTGQNLLGFVLMQTRERLRP